MTTIDYLQAVKLRCNRLQIVPKGIFEENKEVREQQKAMPKMRYMVIYLVKYHRFLAQNAKKEAALQLLPW